MKKLQFVALAQMILVCAMISSIALAAETTSDTGTSDQAVASAPVKTKASKSGKSKKKKSSAKAAKHAAASTKGEAVKTAKVSKGKLSRDVVFDGSVVNGKYLASGEAVSTVENEKSLNNLIGMRADFKDRLGDQRAQLRSGTTDK